MRKWLVVAAVVLAVWIVSDYALGGSHSLRNFDGRAVGHLETAMWRSYYEHKPVSLFGELVQLLREQYHLPLWRSIDGAYHAARAAEVFQAGHNRAEYEKALPHLISFYALIRRASDVPFDAEKSARLELEWWVIHRERAHHAEGDLEHALASLQAEIYQHPEGAFAWHAKARANAMLIRDTRAASGGVSEQDWARIETLLDSSWASLQAAVVGE